MNTDMQAPASSVAVVQDSVPADSPARGVGDHKHNNFDVLRLFAAAAVLVSHSFALSSKSEPSIGKDSIGAIAVLMFFAISGFLITQSWLREPRIVNYIVKRALRIMPALAVVLLISAFVLGPLVTTLSLGDYLRSSDTWTYVLNNLRFHTDYTLPGVFAGNPYPDAVNGSLWTLPGEMHAYIVIAVVGLIGLLKTPRVAVLVLLGVCLIPVVAPGNSERFLGDPFLIRAFAFGAILLICRKQVPWRGWLAGSLIAAWIALALIDESAGQWLGAAAITYATIFVAYHSPLSLGRLTARGDVSYGLYLYAFPVQQVIAQLWHDITPLAMIALALPVTYALALASWMLIEHPALRLKSRLRRVSPAVLTPDPRPVVYEEAGS